MEAPLSAREFLRRFHLPQLVRISSFDGDDGGDLSVDQPASIVARVNREISDGPRSLMANLPVDEHGDETKDGEPRFASISAWSSRQVDRMISDGRLPSMAVRMPRASLASSGARRQLTNQHQDEQAARVLSENEQPIDGRPNQATKTQQQQQRTANSSQGIRLMPPSKRSTLCKLQLNQPFLLYKAYRKLELCAYAIDTKNELSGDKSGDPIYFPHNYPGWFLISPYSNGNRFQQDRPLDTIDQVCRAGSQVFITRDELTGHQLPKRLSHLTKLKNNQLLALPLAINLSSFNGKSNSSSATSSSSPKGTVSDIKQIKIAAGQALKICAVYEDVMPSINDNQHHYRVGERLKMQHHRNQHAFPEPSLQQQCVPAGVAQRSLNLYQTQLLPSISRQKSNMKPSLMKSNPAHISGTYVAAAPPLIYAGQMSPNIMGPQHAQAPPMSSHYNFPPPATKGSLMAPQPVGQRYARCVLLSETSLRKMLNLTTGRAQPMESAGMEEEEIEILLPLNQQGRFYVCATDQNLLDELQCQSCFNAYKPNQPPKVYQLSQIVALISLSKRIATVPTDNRQRGVLAQTKPRQSTFKLPLHVQLVIGPRPANFSPSMLGSSSTMESYFRCEQNIGGHKLACKFNKGDPKNDSACDCANSVADMMSGCVTKNESYGLFSAVLRIETLKRRDVLLACTIKKNPLERLDPIHERAQLMAATSASDLETIEGKSLSERRSGGDVSLKNVEGSKQQDGVDCHITKHQLTLLHENNRTLCLDSAKTIGKSSSFSRLRACRSLISLNGRKNKKRPGIPSSMIAEQSGDRSKNSLLRTHSQDTPGDQSGSKTADGATGQANNGEIILVEFDCNNEDLHFVRTFVESSIPTSTIPDLVLNRMEYCHRNSLTWERQLKLSYATLGRDFNSCKRQILANYQQQQKVPPLSRSGQPVQRRQSSIAFSLAQPSVAENRRSSSLSMNGSSTGSSSSSISLACMIESQEMAQRGPDETNTASRSIDSSSSSRSSSGVSSAGERAATASGRSPAKVAANANQANSGLTYIANGTNEAAQTSSSSLSSASSSGAGLAISPSANATTTGANRLLRLVHKILPPFSGAASKLAVGHASETTVAAESEMASKVQPEIQQQPPTKSIIASKADQRRGLVDELNGKLKRELNVVGAGQHTSADNGSPGGTCGMASGSSRERRLQASQKRQQVGQQQQRQPTGSSFSEAARPERHPFEDDELFLFQADHPQAVQEATETEQQRPTLMNAQKIHRKLMKSASARHLASDLPGQKSSDDEGEQSSECSHLYESLERINEAIAADAKSANVAQKVNTEPVKTLDVNKTTQQGTSLSLGNLGRSMDFLFSGHAVNIESRRGTESSSAGAHQGAQGIFIGGRAEDYEDEDDLWWQESTKTSQQAKQQRTAVALFGRRRGHQACNGKRDNLDDAMEPISIEASYDDFMSLAVDSNDEGELPEELRHRRDRHRKQHHRHSNSPPTSATSSSGGELASSGSSSSGFRPDNSACNSGRRRGNDEHHIYVNLPAQQQQQQQQEFTAAIDERQTQGRMERKLAKIRGRRPISLAEASREASLAQSWTQLRDYLDGRCSSTSASSQCDSAECELRSLNLNVRKLRYDQWTSGDELRFNRVVDTNTQSSDIRKDSRAELRLDFKPSGLSLDERHLSYVPPEGASRGASNRSGNSFQSTPSLSSVSSLPSLPGNRGDGDNDLGDSCLLSDYENDSGEEELGVEVSRTNIEQQRRTSKKQTGNQVTGSNPGIQGDSISAKKDTSPTSGRHSGRLATLDSKC